MRYKIKTLVISSLLVLIFSACSFSGLVDKSDNSIGIRGTITKINTTENGISILVEGEKETDTQYDKASVSIDKNTVIQDSSKNKIKINELEPGYKVEVIMTGPVLESYPVQGKAKKVVVISKNNN